MNEKLKEFLNTSIYFLVVVIFAFLIVKFVAQRTEVIGESMMETLYNGDNLILNKISYRFSDPKRFDIVVFPFRDNSGKNYIKRVIGLPGETVQIDENGNILINDKILDEDYGRETILSPGIALEKIVLGEGEYFVLGDNRNKSEDSRFGVGKVFRNEIVGKVTFRIWPLSNFGKIDKK